MLTIDNLAPEWRTLRIHESSPGHRGVSRVLQRNCPSYVATQFFPNVPLGSEHSGFRCEDLERQTFADESFDLVVTQDVMEHVFEPEAAYREVWRTLRPGGLYLHTTPIYKERVTSVRRAARLADGSISYLAKPEYHGNPIDAQGSLVTWHFGYDLPDLIARWTPFDVEARRFNDRRHGVVAEFTEVIACKKR
jgi:SAM-dependent methyltransferase